MPPAPPLAGGGSRRLAQPSRERAPGAAAGGGGKGAHAPGRGVRQATPEPTTAPRLLGGRGGLPRLADNARPPSRPSTPPNPPSPRPSCARGRQALEVPAMAGDSGRRTLRESASRDRRDSDPAPAGSAGAGRRRQARERALQLVQKHAGNHAREAAGLEWVLRLIMKVDQHCMGEVKGIAQEKDALVEELKRLQEEVVGPVREACENIAGLEARLEAAEANARIHQESRAIAERELEEVRAGFAEAEGQRQEAQAEAKRLEMYLQQTKQEAFLSKVTQANRSRDLREGMQRVKCKLREQNQELQQKRFHAVQIQRRREEEETSVKALKSKISVMSRDFSRQKDFMTQRVEELENIVRDVHSYRHHVPVGSSGARVR